MFAIIISRHIETCRSVFFIFRPTDDNKIANEIVMIGHARIYIYLQEIVSNEIRDKVWY